MSALIACLLWLLLFRLAAWGRRYQAEHGITGATRSTAKPGVSRNTGPKWEQDVPISMAEIDAHQEDDL